MTYFKENIFLFMAALIIRDNFSFNFSNKVPSRYRSCLNELRENGVCIYPDLLSEEIVSESKQIIDNNLSLSETFGSDQRIEELNKFSKYIEDNLSNHEITKAIGEKHTKSALHLQRSMAGKLSYEPNNLGSGQGWHRDSYSQQFKTMFYLSDVDENHGPFEYVHKSHHYKYIYKELKLKKQYLRKNNTHSRFDQDTVSKYILENKLESKKYIGPKGTIVLFDSRGLHRGSPINNGERYAITNYFINKWHHK